LEKTRGAASKNSDFQREIMTWLTSYFWFSSAKD